MTAPADFTRLALVQAHLALIAYRRGDKRQALVLAKTARLLSPSPVWELAQQVRGLP